MLRLWEVPRNKLLEKLAAGEVKTVLCKTEDSRRLVSKSSFRKVYNELGIYYSMVECNQIPDNYHILESDDQIGEATDEIHDYLRTLSVNSLLNRFKDGCLTSGIEIVLAERVAANHKVIDQIRHKQIAARVLVRAIAMPGANFKVLDAKKDKFDPPQYYGLNGFTNLRWYCEWVSTVKNNRSYLRSFYNNLPPEEIAILADYFPIEDIMRTYLCGYAADHTITTFVRALFEKISMQEFLESLYAADEKESIIRIRDVSDAYFQLLHSCDV